MIYEHYIILNLACIKAIIQPLYYLPRRRTTVFNFLSKAMSIRSYRKHTADIVYLLVPPGPRRVGKLS